MAISDAVPPEPAYLPAAPNDAILNGAAETKIFQTKHYW
jgi:hypothetical protein